MHVAVGEGGDVLLVDLAYGVVVVEIGVAVDEDVVEAGAEQAGDSEVEDSGDFVGEEGEETVEEEEDYDEPFEEDGDEEIR